MNRGSRKKMKGKRKMNCPICGKNLSIESLRYDPSFLKNCGTLFIGDDYLDDDPGNFF